MVFISTNAAAAEHAAIGATAATSAAELRNQKPAHKRTERGGGVVVTESGGYADDFADGSDGAASEGVTPEQETCVEGLLPATISSSASDIGESLENRTTESPLDGEKVDAVYKKVEPDNANAPDDIRRQEDAVGTGPSNSSISDAEMVVPAGKVVLSNKEGEAGEEHVPLDGPAIHVPQNQAEDAIVEAANGEKQVTEEEDDGYGDEFGEEEPITGKFETAIIAGNTHEEQLSPGGGSGAGARQGIKEFPQRVSADSVPSSMVASTAATVDGESYGSEQDDVGDDKLADAPDTVGFVESVEEMPAAPIEQKTSSEDGEVAETAGAAEAAATFDGESHEFEEYDVDDEVADAPGTVEIEENVRDVLPVPPIEHRTPSEGTEVIETAVVPEPFAEREHANDSDDYEIEDEFRENDDSPNLGEEQERSKSGVPPGNDVANAVREEGGSGQTNRPAPESAAPSVVRAEGPSGISVPDAERAELSEDDYADDNEFGDVAIRERSIPDEGNDSPRRDNAGDNTGVSMGSDAAAVAMVSEAVDDGLGKCSGRSNSTGDAVDNANIKQPENLEPGDLPSVEEISNTPENRTELSGTQRSVRTGPRDAAATEDSSSLEGYYPSDLDDEVSAKKVSAAEADFEDDFEADEGDSISLSIREMQSAEQAEQAAKERVDGASCDNGKVDAVGNVGGQESSFESFVVATETGEDDASMEGLDDDDFEEDVEQEDTTSANGVEKAKNDSTAEHLKGELVVETPPKLEVPSVATAIDDAEVDPLPSDKNVEQSVEGLADALMVPMGADDGGSLPETLVTASGASTEIVIGADIDEAETEEPEAEKHEAESEDVVENKKIRSEAALPTGLEDGDTHFRGNSTAAVDATAGETAKRRNRSSEGALASRRSLSMEDLGSRVVEETQVASSSPVGEVRYRDKMCVG